VGDNVRDQSSVANERAIELLKVLGKLGFSSMDESIELQIQN
jgi:hypothetical protein